MTSHEGKWSQLNSTEIHENIMKSSDIKFIEVKSGKSRLNKNQRRIRDAVTAKRIEWVEVRVKDSEIEIEEKALPCKY